MEIIKVYFVFMFGKSIKMFIKIKVISFNLGSSFAAGCFSSISCICYRNSISDHSQNKTRREREREKEGERGKEESFWYLFSQL